MVRGLYSQMQSPARLYSINEIATLCCTSSPKVQNWIDSDLLKSARNSRSQVEASELISFLLANGLPVPPSILPPRTKKILFVANETETFSKRSNLISQLCHDLAQTGLVLAEVSQTGRTTDLKILRFVPDAVVFFLEIYNRSTMNTFNLLASMPELKTVLIVPEETEKILIQKHAEFSADLILSDRQTTDELSKRFTNLFTN